MSTVGEQIREARKQKGLTQEQLAEKVDRNLRTVQRIENSENAPRNETLSLICEVLEIKLEESEPIKKEKFKKWSTRIMHWLFLVPLNFVFIGIFGWTIVAHDSSTPSRFAALILSFLIPYFIVQHSARMSGIERILKFGLGLIYFTVLKIITIGFDKCMACGLIPSVVFFLVVLFYGNEILRLLNAKDK